YIIQSAFLLGIVSLTSCKKEFVNPNAPTTDQVFSSSRGLVGANIGIQRTFSFGGASVLYGVVTANAFTTNEVILMNSGNIAEFQFSRGGANVDPTNAILGNIWTNSNKVIYDANTVIKAAESLNDKGYASGLIAHASILKAMAIGSMSMFWEKVPSTTGTNVTFLDRTIGFTNAIATIDNALSKISANPISASYVSDAVAGIDYVNTLYALKARYLLFSGKYADALTAANLVDLTKKSTFNYDAVNTNPIFTVATATNNVYQPVDSTLGLPAALAPTASDGRIAFYTSINTTVLPRFRINGFYNTTTTGIPLYLPSEITLIKAEANARTGNLTTALTELNKVLTKTAAADPFRIGANLPASTASTADAILTEIYKNRCIELFMSGLKLEDMRRFGRANAERKRNFFPYPFRERDGNINTPADPSF
ncbi:MAG: RagB/SusD family nutrient uptake outer membrane protein, partial [Chitinophagaceae bacterium]